MRSNIKKYGSNEKEPWYIQDGIAPQVGEGGLNIIKKPTIGGRAYILRLDPYPHELKYLKGFFS